MSQDIKERIRRLLALSESPNVHEASAAAAKAQELMAKHRIDQAEVAEMAGAADEALLEEDLQIFGARLVTWRSLLAGAVAEANGCDMYNQVWRDAGGRQVRTATRIIGPASSVQAVRYMLAVLERAIGRVCTQERKLVGANQNKWMASFRLGVAHEVGRRVVAAARAARLQAVGHGCALARINRDAERVAAAMAAKTMKPARKAEIRHSAAFMEGIAAGREVELANGVAALPSGPAAALRGGS